MMVLAGQYQQGDAYETLTEERSEELSSPLGLGLEPDSEGPPFVPMVSNARCWKGRVLTYVALLMAWGEGLSLTDRFGTARAVVREMFPAWSRVGQTYQGFIKALLLQGRGLVEGLGVGLGCSTRGR